MKKILATSFVICLFFSLTSEAFANGVDPTYFPSDIKNHWAYNQLNDLADADILNGYQDQDGTINLKPDGLITRAELAQMLVRAVGENVLNNFPKEDKAFVDVTEKDWFYPTVHLLASIGFVDGVGDGRFEPNRPIRRDEIAAMIDRVFQVTDGTYPLLTKHFKDVPDYWATPHIERLTKAGMINGYDNDEFRPAANATRAEAATIIYNVLHKFEGAPSDETLTNVVLDDEKEYIEILKSKDYERLYQLNEKNSTGYYNALNTISADYILALVQKGYSYSATLKTQYQVKVKEKSAFRAVVELSNDVYEVAHQAGDVSETQTVDASADFDLMYVPSENAWKIYDVRYLNDPGDKLGNSNLASEILKSMTTAMNASSSFSAHMVETGSSEKTDIVVDYIKSPFEYHSYGTDTINNETRPTVETYVKDGMRYETDNGVWTSYPQSGMTFSNLMPNSELNGKEYLLAPYLNIQESGNLYTIYGTVDMNVYSKLFPNNEINWTKMKNYRFVFVIDKATKRMLSETWTRNLSSGESYTWQIDFKDFNQVAPVVIPESVLKAVQK
jgi:hypothetical protein